MTNVIKIGETKRLTVQGIRGRDHCRLEGGSITVAPSNPMYLRAEPVEGEPDVFLLTPRTTGQCRLELAWTSPKGDVQLGSVDLLIVAEHTAQPIRGLAGLVE